MAKKVFLGVGHGGSDPGAVGNGFKEKDLNLSIAKACCDELKRHGVDVKMSRTKDENDDVTERIKECNAFNPDLALDIHNNAGGGDGAEVYYYSGGGKSKTMANNVLAEIVKIGQNSRGAKVKKNSSGQDYFAFIRETNPPAVIVECAFVDNKTDIAIIDTVAEQKKMGVAIAKGVLKTLGIAYKQEPKTLETNGFRYGDNSVGVLALKELLLIAKSLKIQPKGMYEDTGFGAGTRNAVNYLLKMWGYTENGIAGTKFVKKLVDEIYKKIK